jgi:hypothetical protein
VDAYLLAPGTDLDDESPNLPRLATAGTSNYVNLDPGNYELTVTETAEKTVLAGPLTVNVTSGSIREVAIVDTADPNLLDIVVYE